MHAAIPDDMFADDMQVLVDDGDGDSDDELDIAVHALPAAPAAQPAPAPNLSAAIEKIVQVFSSRMLSKPALTGTAPHLQLLLSAKPADAALAAFQSNLPVVLSLALSTWLNTNVISFASVARLLGFTSPMLALLGLAFPRSVDSLLDIFSFSTHTGLCKLSGHGDRPMQMHYLVLCRGCNNNAVPLSQCTTVFQLTNRTLQTVNKCNYKEFHAHRTPKFNAECNTPWLSKHARNNHILVAKANQRVYVLGTLRVAFWPC